MNTGPRHTRYGYFKSLILLSCLMTYTGSAAAQSLVTPDLKPSVNPPIFLKAPEPSKASDRPLINKVSLNRRINGLMQKKGMVGLSIAVVENGQLTFSRGYGERMRGSGQRVTPDTVFRWASVSKGVGAAVALTLVEDGAFTLQSAAQDFAPSLIMPPVLEFSGDDDELFEPDEITSYGDALGAMSEISAPEYLAAPGYRLSLEDVLSHRVGVVRNAYDGYIESGQTGAEVRRALKNLSYVCAPGTCHTYQNAAYDAVSEMAETVTGLPYKAVVSERIFKPLHMTSASTTLEGLTRSKDWARPHNRSGNKVLRVKPTYYRVPGAAGVNSSVVDLSKWMQAQMRDDVFSKAVRQEMQTPRIYTPREQRFLRRRYSALRNAHYGLGWRVYNYEGHKVVGHRGGVEGYRALVLFDPEIQSGVAVMWNSGQSRPTGLQMEVMDAIYQLPKRDWLKLDKD